MKRRYMNTDKTQWKEPELTTLISEEGGVTKFGYFIIQFQSQSL